MKEEEKGKKEKKAKFLLRWGSGIIVGYIIYKIIIAITN